MEKFEKIEMKIPAKGRICGYYSFNNGWCCEPNGLCL